MKGLSERIARLAEDVGRAQDDADLTAMCAELAMMGLDEIAAMEQALDAAIDYFDDAKAGEQYGSYQRFVVAVQPFLSQQEETIVKIDGESISVVAKSGPE